MTPRDHYLEAERLLRVYGAEADPEHPTLKIAHVHALLALAPAGYGDEYTVRLPVAEGRRLSKLGNVPTVWADKSNDGAA